MSADGPAAPGAGGYVVRHGWRGFLGSAVGRRLRFTEVEGLDMLLSRAGLAVVERYGQWDRRPFTRQLPEIITIATGG